MQTGIFAGIENGIMKIEYPVSELQDGKVIMSTRVFTYPVGSNPRRDTAFYGFGPKEGTIGFGPDLPAIGQKVQFDSPEPDGAGHLMVNVYPEAA
jgi:hypothetical protein